MAEPWTPNSEDLAAIFAPVRGYARLVLAVSGGSDSTALLNLAVRWARSIGTEAPTISAATVDHGLRPGSAAEAHQVAEVARALGVEARVLAWCGAKPERGIQERAREMRYGLLAQYASETGLGPCAILTAHTRDDQAETVLMRLARGSGPDGLQGMRGVRALESYSNLVLARPLLNYSRDQLRSFLVAHGIRWFDDPSNEDRRFERVRLRAAAGILFDLGLTPSMLALSAERQQRAVAALEAATDAAAAAALDLHGGMFASIEARVFRSAADEIQIRLLNRVLKMFGGGSGPAELAQIERVARLMSTSSATRVTLGGCEVRACNREIRIFRERGRAQLTPIQIDPGQEAIWDHRFHIRHKIGSGPPITGPMVVRPLDATTVEMLRRRAPQRLTLPMRAAATLPAVWLDDALVSVGGLPPSLFSEAGDAVSKVEMRFLSECGRVAP
ncbi:MAG: tRNA lysidine(34) synthetase TilS [Hyphomicrobium sp.]|nr:tRNA lysidine(34) synthetase TilS [Hyphomicrobium sp.]